MDDIKIFTRKRIKGSYIKYHNRQRNGIGDWKMYHAWNKRRKKKDTPERIEFPNQESMRSFREKKLQIFGNIECGNHKPNGDERKSKNGGTSGEQ